jgi:LysM repeat protein
MHKVVPGDDLISIIWGCGYRTLDIMPTVLEMNKLSSPEMIQVGQDIVVPWPTATPDSNGAADGQADTAVVMNSDGEVQPTDIGIPGLVIAALPTQGPPTPIPSPTLLPGVMWHTVQTNENIAVIAYAYNTSLETLSQLNPEVTFSQCDFGKPTGGDTCTVLIQPGQQLRVPAPTPTATLSPTLSGSETATPTLTATFNAPSPLSPADRSLFEHDELVTLRWVGSGTLDTGETYRVMVEDVTSGQTYSSDTTDLSLILPADWQGQDGKRHDYRWTVSVIRLDDPDHPTFTTEPRLFTWEGR